MKGVDKRQVRTCGLCDEQARMKTPYGPRCPQHAFEEHLAEATNGTPTWFPLVIEAWNRDVV